MDAPKTTKQAGWMDRMRLRTALLVPLLLLSVGGTVTSLLILRMIVQQQVAATLASDLQHSVKTYQNLARQRRELLARESALLADLPSLKALMTGDAPTIVDGGVEFWHVSGSDLFALLDSNGKLVATYNRGAPLDRSTVRRSLEADLDHLQEPVLLSLDHRLYEVSVEPLLFGDRSRNSGLGFLVVGYSVDAGVAREVSESAAAEVTLTVDGDIVASTLKPSLQAQLAAQHPRLFDIPNHDYTLQLGNERYLATAVPLGRPHDGPVPSSAPHLIVLKSFAQASVLLRRVNQWVLTLAVLALLTGTVMLLSISRFVADPIQTLVEGTRALAMGNFEYRLSEDGIQEIRELSRAFERMRVELQRTQRDLLDSERLATIGRMASSISHDLRHYLSAMYANAEFLSDDRLQQPEREELFAEVQAAVSGMTDLLDSLLLFTQTGRALHPALNSVTGIIERAAGLVRSHPAARNVLIAVDGSQSLEALVDSRKLGRAVYNLLLNACQAAHRGGQPPEVTVRLQEDEHSFRVLVADNGSGVPEGLRQTMYLPFVSEGKASGTGLGLTLAQQIAQEHGGSIALEEGLSGLTVFVMTIPKNSPATAASAAERNIRQMADAPFP